MELRSGNNSEKRLPLCVKSFLLYSILGCLVELIFILIIAGKFAKSGFLYGPFVPIYGASIAIATIIYKALCRPNKNNSRNFKSKAWRLAMFCLICLVGVTLAEFLVGNFFELVFGVVIWDHSKSFGFVPGGKYVNLLITPALGISLIIAVLVINKHVEKVIFKIPGLIFKILLIVFVLDCIFSIVIKGF